MCDHCFSFDFCQVGDAIEEGKIVKDSDPVENLGQVLFGERLKASAYNVRPSLTVTKSTISSYISVHGYVWCHVIRSVC